MAESKAIKNQKRAPKDRDDKKGSSQPIWQRAIDFLREVKSELRKVVWPPRKQVMTSTIVVLVLVIIAASFLGLVDFILARIVKLILGIGG